MRDLDMSDVYADAERAQQAEHDALYAHFARMTETQRGYARYMIGQSARAGANVAIDWMQVLIEVDMPEPPYDDSYFGPDDRFNEVDEFGCTSWID